MYSPMGHKNSTEEVVREEIRLNSAGTPSILAARPLLRRVDALVTSWGWMGLVHLSMARVG